MDGLGCHIRIINLCFSIDQVFMVEMDHLLCGLLSFLLHLDQRLEMQTSAHVEDQNICTEMP